MSKRPASLPFFILLIVFCAGVAHAQTVVNPRTVEFDPSADHTTLTADSQPMVQRYDLEIYTVGGTVASNTISLGKPAPQTDGKIRVDVSALGVAWPLPDGSYQARVAAIGPTGKAASDPSNTFAFQSCTISLGGTSMSVPAGGATGAVWVNANTSCSWTARSDAGWAALGSTSGTGPGSLNFTVLANIGTAPRTATLTIGGQAFLITQAGAAACSFSLTPLARSVPDSGGAGTVSVASDGGCNWTVSSNGAWVTLGSTLGAGPSTVSYTVQRNTQLSPRTATLTIGGVVHTITQAGATPCSYSLSATSQAFSQGAGSGSVSVTCGSACSWAAASGGAAWVTLATAGGSGPGAVSYTISKNPTTSIRTATLNIAGSTYTITQAAANRPTSPKKVRVVTVAQ